MPPARHTALETLFQVSENGYFILPTPATGPLPPGEVRPPRCSRQFPDRGPREGELRPLKLIDRRCQPRSRDEPATGRRPRGALEDELRPSLRPTSRALRWFGWRDQFWTSSVTVAGGPEGAIDAHEVGAARHLAVDAARGARAVLRARRQRASSLVVSISGAQTIFDRLGATRRLFAHPPVGFGRGLRAATFSARRKTRARRLSMLVM